MLIPIRTDYRMSRTPVVNYALIAVNVVLFLMGYNGATSRGLLRISTLMLNHENPQLYQFFTSMFLHASWMHLIGNMVFLWVFGNAINDKFGNVGYLGFYLAGGLCAGIGYLLTTPQAPVLGASGAISAVTGAFLVLLPRVNVTLLVFFFFITFFEASSLFFLLFQLLFNLWGTADVLTRPGGGGVAYSAHLAGYVYGILAAVLLLVSRLLPRDAYDLLNLIKTWKRRTSYKRMVARGNDPFGYSRVKHEERSRRVETRKIAAAPSDTLSARELQLRREISQAWQDHDLPQAAQLYLQLVQISEDAILPRQQQLDVANQLMADQRHPAAADAYERYLRHYPSQGDQGDIHLMLGLLYGRYLHQYDRAEDYLQRAINGLSDPRKVELARSDLADVEARKRR